MDAFEPERASTVPPSQVDDGSDEVVRRELEALIEGSPAAIVRLDLTHRSILYASPQFEQLTGEPVALWLGEAGYARWASRMVEQATPDWEARGRAGRAWTNRYRWRRGDGEWRWFHSRTQIVAAGVAQAVIFDETLEVELERALAKEQLRYQVLVEQLPATVFRSRADGTLSYVSPHFGCYLGYERDELVDMINGSEGWQLYHPDDVAAVQRLSAQLVTGEIESCEFEARYRRRDGGYRTMIVRRARVVDADDTVEIASLAMDVTELRAAQARTREVLEVLVGAAEAERARIAAELHDDTIQLLVALQLKVESLTRRAPLIAELSPLLEQSLERTRRLAFELRPQILDHAGLAAALCEVANEGPWANAEVDIQVPRLTATDEAVIYRAVRELILNARKHSHASKLSIRGRFAQGRATFRVEDDGVGFDPAAALDPAQPRLHLGLDITRERARLAGGHLSLESAPNHGTRATVEFPVELRSSE